MKKTIYFFVVCFSLLGTVACGNANRGANDSDTVVAVEEVDSDSIVPCSMVGEYAPVNDDPEECLILEVVKKNLHYAPESTNMTGSWTVKITNDSNCDIKGSDYVVAYDEVVEEFNDKEGTIDDVTKNRIVNGVDITAGESVTIELKPQEGCQTFKNPEIKSLK